MKTTLILPLSASVIALGLLVTGCGGGGGDDSSNDLASSRATRTYSAELAIEWNEFLYAEVKARGVDAPAASRLFAYTGVAQYEALVRGMPDRKTLQGQLNGLPTGTIPGPSNQRYHWPSVANRAFAVVSASLLPPASMSAIDALEAHFVDEFASDESGDVIDRSIDYGEAIATAILTWAAADGFSTACVFTPPVSPSNGGFTAVPGASGDGLLPCFGSVRTFVVGDGQECAPDAPPSYSTSPSSAYYSEALVVYNTTGDLGLNLTSEQSDIARYWSDAPTATGTPPGHWIGITCQMCDMLVLNLERAGQHFAAVGLALGDAYVTCWNAKYAYYLARPVTYIRAHVAGGAGWDPLVTTPNDPTFTSAHATQSGAVATVLMAQIGLVPFTDTTHSRLDGASGLPSDRHFASFDDAAAEAAISGVYAGVHYGFDDEAGYESGVCIGNVINAYVRFLSHE